MKLDFILPEVDKVSVPSETVLSPEQLAVLARLEAYRHEFFDLTSATSNGDPNCLVCVAGCLGRFSQEADRLIEICGGYIGDDILVREPEAARLMRNLVSADYGRGVPLVRNYHKRRIPKAVAIQAVRSIFEMSQKQ